jgi:hypothetical protein
MTKSARTNPTNSIPTLRRVEPTSPATWIKPQLAKAGPVGLAGGKRVIIASSRGGLYAPGMPFEANDFQEPYLARSVRLYRH